MEKKSLEHQLGDLAADPGQGEAHSAGSSIGSLTPTTSWGKTPEAADRSYATKLLPQGHYVTSVYLPSANYQRKGSQDALPSPCLPNPQAAFLETRYSH